MILNESQLKEITEKLLTKLRQGEEAEITLAAVDTSLTRYARNTIHQNVNELSNNLMLTLYDGQRKGFAMGTQIEDAALEQLLQQARQAAGAAAENPQLLRPAQPQPLRAVASWDEATANYKPEQRAEHIAKLAAKCAAKGYEAYGSFVTGEGAYAFANSQGIFAAHRNSWAEYSAIVQKGEASVRAEGSAWHIDALDIPAIGDEALAKLDVGSQVTKVEPGEYTVVFDPYATADLVFMLVYHGVSAEQYLEGRSWMSGISGEKKMHESVNIWDDGYDLAGIPQPFDFEGMPKKRLDIVSKGVVGSPAYNRRTAALGGVETTGHAIPPIDDNDAPLPLNLFMAPGDSSVAEMIKSTERGLYITRFWYTRLMHPTGCVITGMTRDGVFLIENGKLVAPVKNLRFIQSYVEALDHVEAISADTRLIRNDLYNFSISCRVPAVKLSKFKFTGTTK